MRLYGRGLPSSFTFLDDRTTTADQCANVWSKQTFRNNHNILLARRCRQPLLTVHMDNDSAGSASTGPTGFTWRSILTPDRESGVPILQVPIEIPPYCTSVKVNFDAYKSSEGTMTAELYPIIDGPGTFFQINPAVSATISATSYTVVGVSVPVPQSARDYGHGTLTIYASTQVYDTDLKGGGSAAILDVGHDWAEATIADFSAFTEGRLAYVDTDLTISPRRIIRRDTFGLNYRIYLEFPWNKMPLLTDTMQAREISYIYLRTISAYADVISDFSAEVVPL